MLGVILLIGFSRSVSAQTLYSDSMNHYSFTLPTGWEEIPKVVIDQFMDALVEQTDGQRIEYEAGFQLSGNEHFQYPYMLVQKSEDGTFSYSQFEKVFDDSNFQTSLEQKAGEYSELLTGATFEEPFVDKERGIIFMNVEFDVANVGKVHGLLAMFLGKERVIQLNFYAESDGYSDWLPVFTSMINSFRYETAYAYDPESAMKDEASPLFERMTLSGLGGAIAGALFASIAVFVGWIIKKRRK